MQLPQDDQVRVQRPADLALAQPLRAGSFIVTLFGDVIAPRGGDVWIGNIIAFCAPFGISETLIRTAMSRLVSAGQIAGLRQGRRSFYRLTEVAQNEYAQAGARIYGDARAEAWRLVFCPQGDAVARCSAGDLPSHVALTDSMALGPRSMPLPEGLCAITGTAEGSDTALHDMARRLWDLDALDQEYTGFLGHAEQINKMMPLPGAEALEARVLLVHAFRQIALRDPRLPHAALPADWAGIRARIVFAQTYLALSAEADSHVAAAFEGAEGPLQSRTRAGEARYALLRESLRV